MSRSVRWTDDTLIVSGLPVGAVAQDWEPNATLPEGRIVGVIYVPHLTERVPAIEALGRIVAGVGARIHALRGPLCGGPPGVIAVSQGDMPLAWADDDGTIEVVVEP